MSLKYTDVVVLAVLGVYPVDMLASLLSLIMSQIWGGAKIRRLLHPVVNRSLKGTECFHARVKTINATTDMTAVAEDSRSQRMSAFESHSASLHSKRWLRLGQDGVWLLEYTAGEASKRPSPLCCMTLQRSLLAVFIIFLGAFFLHKVATWFPLAPSQWLKWGGCTLAIACLQTSNYTRSCTELFRIQKLFILYLPEVKRYFPHNCHEMNMRVRCKTWGNRVSSFFSP